jgi:hypothetical protein
MNNIVLITSIIDTPNTPFNYTNVRSVFTKNQRFEQLKLTIKSIREKIPLSKIILVECSIMEDEIIEYIDNNVDYFLNIYEPKNIQLINEIFSDSKAMGEGVMTIFALEYLFNNDITFDNLFKISGRYWLNDEFNYLEYNNINNIIHKINGETHNFFTCFYKLNYNMVRKWLEYLKTNKYNLLDGNLGYENVFALFMDGSDYKTVDKVGINGYVSVCGTFIDM